MKTRATLCKGWLHAPANLHVVLLYVAVYKGPRISHLS